MRNGVITRNSAVLTAVGGAVAGLYGLAIRPWHLRWGATDKEVGRDLPGDELVPHPKLVSTRAVTIRARSAEIWPWLVQVGEGRGGFYSYAWLENMVGCEMRNADRIIPEMQHLKVGDTVWLARWWHRRFSFPSYLLVSTLDPGRALVLRSPTARRGHDSFSWAFILQELDEQNTRLIVRSRSDWGPGLGDALFSSAFGEPAHFVMERKMMLGIKERAERSVRSSGSRICESLPLCRTGESTGS